MEIKTVLVRYLSLLCRGRRRMGLRHSIWTRFSGLIFDKQDFPFQCNNCNQNGLVRYLSLLCRGRRRIRQDCGIWGIEKINTNQIFGVVASYLNQNGVVRYLSLLCRGRRRMGLRHDCGIWGIEKINTNQIFGVGANYPNKNRPRAIPFPALQGKEEDGVKTQFLNTIFRIDFW